MGYYDTYLLGNHSTNLLAYYKLDDTAGMPQDSGPSGFHASGVGAITYGHSGITGGGTSIGIGDGRYIRLEPDGESTRFRLSTWTLGIWIKGTGTHVTTTISSASFIPVITKGSSESESAGLNEAWLVGLDGATNVGWSDFENNIGTNYKLLGTGAVVDSEWTFLVSTYDGANHRIYRNGVHENNAATTDTPDASTIYACIGSTMNSAGASAGGYYVGTVAHASIWTSALSAADISGLYEAGLQGTELTYLRPISDVSTGNWGISPLYSKINEVTADTGNYISSSFAPINDTCEMALSAPPLCSPVNKELHTLYYQYRKEEQEALPINLTVSLYEGTNLRASGIHEDIQGTWTLGSFTLTTGQSASITNYSNLSVRFAANSS